MLDLGAADAGPMVAHQVAQVPNRYGIVGWQVRMAVGGQESEYLYTWVGDDGAMHLPPSSTGTWSRTPWS